MSNVAELLQSKDFSHINDKGKTIMVEFLNHCAEELQKEDGTSLEDFIRCGGILDLSRQVRNQQEYMAYFLFTFANGSINAFAEMADDNNSAVLYLENIRFTKAEFKEQLKECFNEIVDYGVSLNDTVHYTVDEFDGHCEYDGIVTEIHADHIIVQADGMNLWCDDFNDDMFSINGTTLRERKEKNKV